MIIDDFNVFGPRVRPAEADAILVIDANAVLAQAISLERLKTIARRNPEVVKPSGDLELSKLAQRNIFNVHKSPHSLPLRECLGIGAFEGDDHAERLTRCVIEVKHVMEDHRLSLDFD